ncbi:hypothetical protein GCM10023322_79350 [Rugosimonospora acidiphila]|uniref:Helix-turn-helix domain-containing protein n=1 Tax=Rugosimonospora acidiphila TaxID=556531 RepID=A0ABP9SU87_9ACTN
MTTAPPYPSNPASPPIPSSRTASWTAERIQALGTVTTVPIAAAIFGLSRSVAYDLIKTDQFPVPVLRFGSRYRIPVAAILAALHLPTSPTGDLIDAGESRVDRPHENSRPDMAAPDTT